MEADPRVGRGIVTRRKLSRKKPRQGGVRGFSGSPCVGELIVGMPHLILILVSFCPAKPRALDVTHKRSKMLRLAPVLDKNGVTMGPHGRCEMQEETMNLKHLIVAVPQHYASQATGQQTPDKLSTTWALSPA